MPRWRRPGWQQLAPRLQKQEAVQPCSSAQQHAGSIAGSSCGTRVLPAAHGFFQPFCILASALLSLPMKNRSTDCVMGRIKKLHIAGPARANIFLSRASPQGKTLGGGAAACTGLAAVISGLATADRRDVRCPPVACSSCRPVALLVRSRQPNMILRIDTNPDFWSRDERRASDPGIEGHFARGFLYENYDIYKAGRSRTDRR